MPVRDRRLLLLLALGGVLATATIGSAGGTARPPRSESLADALNRAKAGETEPLARVRTATPEDRYAMAGGCYTVRSAATGNYVARTGGTFAATAADKAQAAPLHFQAFDLGKYLLYGTGSDFLAGASGPLDGGTHAAIRPATGYVKGTGDENLKPVRDPALGAVDAATGTADPTVAKAAKAAKGDGVVAAPQPSAAAEWIVKEAPSGGFLIQQAADDGEPENPGPLDPPIVSTLTASSDGSLHVSDGARNEKAARFTFELADGCAEWPEIGTQVTGPVAAADTAYEETHGYLDAHLHMMAFEFLGGKARCGRPWHPYGVTYALVDCPDHGPGGKGALLEDVLSGNTPGTGHDTVGWPTFGYWPHYSSLTHEQVYYTWLERAWRGGLRMFTNLLVDNGVLCEIYPYKKNSCNEMDGVRLQAQRLHELERYIDAQNGGPGRGWFRIVTDPFQARAVVNSGKLAVVMGIEVSAPFDCGETEEVPRCTQPQIEQRLDEVYALGVRQMELTNKFDNALTGVTGDDGTTGLIVNNGNKYETGHNWKMRTCDAAATEADRTDKTQLNIADGYNGTAPPGGVGRDAVFGAVLQLFGPTGAAPVYPAGPHCNAIGLTDLGRAAISGMARRGMVFDPDHMSAKAREQALTYVAGLGYPGIISSHSWADDATYQAILRLGGVVTPHAGGSAGFVAQWRKLRAWSADDPYVFGVGYGSDVNGFSAQGAPRHPDEANDVDYPFTAMGGAIVDKQVSGEKTWDINTSGVDHYGLYPDWIEDARHVAGAEGDAFMADMQRGVEAYLQMWERAIGIRGATCLTSDGTRAIRRGMSPEQVLVAAGQPKARQDETFTYCATGGATVTVTFGPNGKVRTVAS
jgi:microsomal dipeptidase-like Zn-dependent dipeptidase